jgi:hypothetical protein
MTAFERLWNRLYGDFLAGSGLDDYRALLEDALRAGYESLTIERFWQRAQNSSIVGDRPLLVVRHDIDTDPLTAGQMWEIDKSLGVSSSYYFRLSTLDLDLMARIVQDGGEASYHFEELATVAKDHRVRDRESVIQRIPEAQDRFITNIESLRARTGLPMRVVSSHGDFVNRYLRVPNWAILLEHRVRHLAGVDLEVYDEAFLRKVSKGFSDTQYPRHWSPNDLTTAIRQPVPVLYVLVHPRNWQARPLANAVDDIRRVAEGASFRLARPSRPLAPSAPAIAVGLGGPGDTDWRRDDQQPLAPSVLRPVHPGRERPVLHVRAPMTYEPERRYVLDVVLKDWLGLDYLLSLEDRSSVLITRVGEDQDKGLESPDILFATPTADWLTERAMPSTPLVRLSLRDGLNERAGDGVTDFPEVGPLPVLFAAPTAERVLYRRCAEGIALDADLLGSIFYMVSRYEEVARPALDDHDRYPAYASLASFEGFVGRPVVDEYVNALWAALHELWPDLTRRVQTFRLRLTHDVDIPWATRGQPVNEIAHSLAGDLIRRRNVELAWRRLRSFVIARTGRVAGDPYDTFELLMEMSEQYGLKSTFYFLAGERSGSLDGHYRLTDPPIRRLLRRIHDRGHEVGLHTSYATFRSGALIEQEFADLRAGCAAAGFDQASWGARQHYLRFETPTTWRHLSNAGLEHDSTLGFADDAGFRAGTGREFQVYDLVERRALQLRERPLLVMDATLFGYLGMDVDRAGARARDIVGMAQRMGTDAVLCYHNSSLATSGRRVHYRSLVNDINRRTGPTRPSGIGIERAS